jgi:hypothetical protein
LAATNIRELRVLVQHKGTMLRLCKLMFTSGDASIYLVPYASAGHYFLGGHEFAEQERQATFDFTKQLSSKLKQLPKLSLHETGQVHVQVGRDRAGPLRDTTTLRAPRSARCKHLGRWVRGARPI